MRGLRGKGRLPRQRSSLRAEQFELHIGFASPGVWHREDEPPWLAGGLVRLTGVLWEAGTLYMRITCMLASCRNRSEMVDWKVLEWLSSLPLPSLSQANAPSLLAFWRSSTLEWRLGCKTLRWLGPEEASEKWGGSHYWSLPRQLITSISDLYLWLDQQGLCCDTCQNPKQALHALPWSPTPGWG